MNPFIFTLLIIIGLAVFLAGGIAMVIRLRRNRVNSPGEEQPLGLRHHGTPVSLDSDTPEIDAGSSFLSDDEEVAEEDEQFEIVVHQEADDLTAEEVEPEAIETPEETLEPEIVAEKEEVDEPANIESIEARVDVEEEETHPDLPAYAARAHVSVPSEPLFTVAPPSVEDSEPEVKSEPVQAPVEESEASEDEAIAAEEDCSVIDERDYNFDEVPSETDHEEEELTLTEEVTSQIEEIDSELSLLETLVSDIEKSLEDFDPVAEDIFGEEQTDPAPPAVEAAA